MSVHFYVGTVYTDGSDVHSLDDRLSHENCYHSFDQAELVMEALQRELNDKIAWIFAARCECAEEDKEQ